MVSIVMSVYNADKYLSQAIKSVLNQTYENFEFIIIDDGSKDNSLAIMNRFAKEDDRIKVIHKENSGLTKSLNIGLRETQGEYIARLDADDIWSPSKLEKQIDFLETNNDYALVGTAYDEIDDNDHIIHSKQRVVLMTENSQIRDNIVRFNPFFHSSVVFRKEVLETIGFYNERFKYTQDYEFWVRIMSMYKIANLPEVLASRRYAEGMISIDKEKEQRMYAIQAKLLAITLLDKSVASYKYLINDLIVCLLPPGVTKLIRRIKSS